MYWFEAGSAPIFVHDFKVTLAGYVVCIMFISDLSVFSIIWYAGIWWFVWSWKYWRILYNQYMRFLEVLCVLCPSTVSFSREWGSRSIPAYFNRVWIAGKKGLFPVVDKSNFFSNISYKINQFVDLVWDKHFWKCAFMKFPI